MTTRTHCELRPCMTITDPEALRLIKRFPKEVSTDNGGFHGWQFHAAYRCKEMWFDQELTFAVLRQCADDYGRDIPDREIESCVNSVYDENRNHIRPDWMTKMPKRDDAKINALPDKLLPGVSSVPQTPYECLSRLFGDNVRICVGKGAKDGEICYAGDFKENDEALKRCQFVVPNPMKGKWGLTKEGRRSSRCQDNVLERWYYVCEFDGPPEFTTQKQINAIVELQRITGFKPVMVLSSGGKSLHVWYNVVDLKEQQIYKFRGVAGRYGGCHSTFNTVQFVRMPWGTRNNGNTQEVIYWDASLLEK